MYFDFFKKKKKKKTNNLKKVEPIKKPIDEIKEISKKESQNDVYNGLIEYIKGPAFNTLKKINHEYVDNLYHCLSFLNDAMLLNVKNELSLVYNSTSNAAKTPFWVYFKCLGLKLPKPENIGDNNLILSLRLALKNQEDKSKINELYEEVADDIDFSGLSKKEKIAFLSFLVSIKRYSEYIKFSDSISELEEEDTSFLRSKVHIYLYMGGYQKVKEIKSRTKNNITFPKYVNFLLSLKPAAIDREDAEVLLEALQEKILEKDEVFDAVQLLYKKNYSFEKLTHFLEINSLTDFQRYRIEEMSLEAEQEKALSTSEFKEIDVNFFNDIDEKINTSYEKYFANRDREELDLYNFICDIEKNAEQSYILTESSFKHAYQLACLIKKRIALKIPTSFIRIGDGEALFIPDANSKYTQNQKSLDRILSTWWGDGFVHDETDYHFFSDIISNAVDDADILGVVPKWRIFDNQSYTSDSAKEHRDGFRRFISYAQLKGNNYFSKKIVTSCHAHQSLIRWDMYREIFKGLTSISAITCHNLEDRLLTNFGLNIDKQYFIPPEDAYSSRFEHKNDVEVMYPDCMKRITAEIEVQPGEVFLVAAGFVGKYFCKLIKSRGGIAIDIGSAADYFMGHQTRVFSHNEIEFEPRPYLVNGLDMQSHEISKSYRKSIKEFIKTDSRSHKNIAECISEKQSCVNKKIYKLALIGHPRCASGYVSGVMSNSDIKLGHERYSRDGICSWMLSVNDIHVPWGDSALNAEFKMKIAYARSPLQSIPSIVMENCSPRSFSFRRYHIYDIKGIDIACYKSPLERAIASYTYWYDLVLENELSGIIRVEYIEHDIIKLIPKLNSIGFNVNEDIIFLANKNYVRTNESSYKFDFKKPQFSESDWRNICESLKRDLNNVSKRLGYNEPFSGDDQ